MIRKPLCVQMHLGFDLVFMAEIELNFSLDELGFNNKQKFSILMS